VLYEPRVQPFGMPLSPWVCEKLMLPVVAALRLRGYEIDAYVDDFAASGGGARLSSRAAATAGRVDIPSLLQRLGIPVQPAKRFPIGTTCLPLLRYLLDTARQLVLLPPPRLAKLVSGAKALLLASRRRSRRASSKTLQRFSGMAV